MLNLITSVLNDKNVLVSIINILHLSVVQVNDGECQSPEVKHDVFVLF